jgi:hypothetical protein
VPGAAIAAVALLVAGVVAWRMTFVPAPQTLLVRSSSHLTHVGCPPNASCLTSRGTVVLGSAPGIPPGTPQRQHPLLAQLLWTTSVLFALLALDAGPRRRQLWATAGAS